MKKYNIGLSLFFTIIGLAVIYLSKGLKSAEHGFGAGTWPSFLAITLITLSFLLLIEALFKTKKSPDEKEKAPIDFTSQGMKRVYLIILILTLYSAIQKLVGFYISCGIMLPLVLLVMGERRPWILIAVTGCVILAIFCIFGLVLNTPLPKGTIFS